MIKYLHWWQGINVGDAVSPIIVEWMLGHKVKYAVSRTFFDEFKHFIRERFIYRHSYKWSAPREKVLYAVGSILDGIESNGIVWGAGLCRDWSRLHSRPVICAVRGRYTLQNLPKCYDKSKIAIGDPALLLPLIIKPPVPKETQYMVGLIPHFEDYATFNSSYGNRYHIIDIRTTNAVAFIQEILKCEFILSTSLHGIIIAHAYGKPALWIRRIEMNVGDFKFHDYFSSVGIPIYDGFSNYDEILSKWDIRQFFKQNSEKAFVDSSTIGRIQQNLIEAFPKEDCY